MIAVEKEQLTIYEVEEFYKKVLRKYQDSEKIEIDLSRVKKIDLSFIQLLLSSKKSCKTFKLKLSNEIAELLNEYGAEKLINNQ